MDSNSLAFTNSFHEVFPNSYSNQFRAYFLWNSLAKTHPWRIYRLFKKGGWFKAWEDQAFWFFSDRESLFM